MKKRKWYFRYFDLNNSVSSFCFRIKHFILNFLTFIHSSFLRKDVLTFVHSCKNKSIKNEGKFCIKSYKNASFTLMWLASFSMWIVSFSSFPFSRVLAHSNQNLVSINLYKELRFLGTLGSIKLTDKSTHFQRDCCYNGDFGTHGKQDFAYREGRFGYIK